MIEWQFFICCSWVELVKRVTCLEKYCTLLKDTNKINLKNDVLGAYKEKSILVEFSPFLTLYIWSGWELTKAKQEFLLYSLLCNFSLVRTVAMFLGIY